jgi:hypothetical protein
LSRHFLIQSSIRILNQQIFSFPLTWFSWSFKYPPLCDCSIPHSSKHKSDEILSWFSKIVKQ